MPSCMRLRSVAFRTSDDAEKKLELLAGASSPILELLATVSAKHRR